MIRYLFALFALLVAGYAAAEDRNRTFFETDSWLGDLFAAAVQSHNEHVTDDEIVEYFEYRMQFNTEWLAKWRNLPPEKRSEIVSQHRKAHKDAGERIRVLRALSPEEQAHFWMPFPVNGMDSARWATTRLLNYSDDEYRKIIAVGIELIAARRKQKGKDADRPGWTQITENFPQEVAFLRPELIRVMSNSCEIYLHKVFGRGVGYSVQKSKDNRWVISSFDHYKSWQNTEIELADE